MKLILGIDPGISGGICVMDEIGVIKHIHKIPTFKMKTGTLTKKGKDKMQTQVDFRELFNILEPIYKYNEIRAYVEEITHLHGFPSSSNFRLGYACGIVHAALQTFGDFYLIKPRLWQKELWEDGDIVLKEIKGGKKRKDPKPTSMECAKRLFSEESFIPKGCRSMHDGLIDAALIAEYGRRHL